MRHSHANLLSVSLRCILRSKHHNVLSPTSTHGKMLTTLTPSIPSFLPGLNDSRRHLDRNSSGSSSGDGGTATGIGTGAGTGAAPIGSGSTTIGSGTATAAAVAAAANRVRTSSGSGNSVKLSGATHQTTPPRSPKMSGTLQHLMGVLQGQSTVLVTPHSAGLFYVRVLRMGSGSGNSTATRHGTAVQRDAADELLVGGPIRHWAVLSERILAHSIRASIVSSYLRAAVSNDRYVLPHVVRKRAIQKVIETARSSSTTLARSYIKVGAGAGRGRDVQEGERGDRGEHEKGREWKG